MKAGKDFLETVYNISPLGSLIEMSVALAELIFKIKSFRIFLVEIAKCQCFHCSEVTNTYNEKFQNFHKEYLQRFFLENQPS